MQICISWENEREKMEVNRVKALMIKDLRVVFRQQRSILFLIIVMILLIMGNVENPIFPILYTVFFLSALLVSTISYDTFENGMPFLLTLPVSKKDYVTEKYILAVGGSVIVNVLATGITYFTATVKGTETELTEFIICACIAEIFILIYSAVGLPVNIRYGTEKGRIIMIMIAVMIGAFLGGSGRIMESEKAESIFQFLSGFEMTDGLVILLVLCLIFTITSYLICIKWMEKKEY